MSNVAVEPRAPVSWYAIEKGWIVVSAAGDVLGQVAEIVSDEELDIFSGIALAGDGAARFVDAATVTGIEPGRVTIDLAAERLASLPVWPG